MPGNPSLTLNELAALVGGQLCFVADDRRISGVASLSEAGPADASFLGNPRYAPDLRTSRAGVALVPEGFTGESAPPLLRVPNPSLAFSQLVEHFAPAPVVYPPGVHPTAVLAPDVVLGRDVSIQPYAVLEAGVRVGEGTVIGAHCFLGQGASVGANSLLHPRVTVAHRCQIGDRVILHSGCVVGSDGFGFETVQGRHLKIPQTGIVVVEDDVEIGSNTTVDRARFGRTRIGSGTKIDNLVQIAHNVELGSHCLIVSQVGISGSTKVGDSVILAGQVGLVGHIEIAGGVVVGAQSGVSKSLPEPGMYIGTPAVPAGEYREQVALIRRLPKWVERVLRLEKSTQPK
jgi:UDP-3-O-[3-hydroxymyristoyl] glucosamine N-acyltransferase